MARGVPAARRALREGRARALIVAQDGAEGQRKKVERLALARGVPVYRARTGAELGAAVGAANVTAAAVTEVGFARALGERWDEGGTREDPGPEIERNREYDARS